MPMLQKNKEGKIFNVPTAKDFGMSSRCAQLHKHNKNKHRGRR